LCDTSFPPETAICLGQLITDPKTPAERLGTPVEMGPQDKILEGFEENVSVSSVGSDGVHVGLSAAVFSFLPFSIGTSKGQSITHQYQIEKVEQKVLIPSEEFVHQSMLQGPVRKYLAKHLYRKAVYMIVGIKLGFCARIVHGTRQALSGSLAGGIPGLAVGIPLDVGAHMGASHMDAHFEEKRILHAFVFAYRLRKIRYFRKTRIKNSIFTRGAELHDLHGRASPQQTPDKQLLSDGGDEVIVIKGIADEDFAADEDDGIKYVDGCYLVGHASGICTAKFSA